MTPGLLAPTEVGTRHTVPDRGTRRSVVLAIGAGGSQELRLHDEHLGIIEELIWSPPAYQRARVRSQSPHGPTPEGRARPSAVCAPAPDRQRSDDRDGQAHDKDRHEAGRPAPEVDGDAGDGGAEAGAGGRAVKRDEGAGQSQTAPFEALPTSLRYFARTPREYFGSGCVTPSSRRRSSSPSSTRRSSVPAATSSRIWSPSWT